MADLTVNVGDWVRFYCPYRRCVVIDVVEYFGEQSYYPRRPTVVTLTATVCVDDVLEVRREGVKRG